MDPDILARLGAANLKLDGVLARLESLDEIEETLRIISATQSKAAETMGTMIETVRALADAAHKKAADDGLGATLRGILMELKNQTGLMVALGAGLERLPGIMEDTAISAATLATGGGVDIK